MRALEAEELELMDRLEGDRSDLPLSLSLHVACQGELIRTQQELSQLEATPRVPSEVGPSDPTRISSREAADQELIQLLGEGAMTGVQTEPRRGRGDYSPAEALRRRGE